MFRLDFIRTRDDGGLKTVSAHRFSEYKKALDPDQDRDAYVAAFKMPELKWVRQRLHQRSPDLFDFPGLDIVISDRALNLMASQLDKACLKPVEIDGERYYGYRCYHHEADQVFQKDKDGLLIHAGMAKNLMEAEIDGVGFLPPHSPSDGKTVNQLLNRLEPDLAAIKQAIAEGLRIEPKSMRMALHHPDKNVAADLIRIFIDHGYLHQYACTTGCVITGIIRHKIPVDAKEILDAVPNGILRARYQKFTLAEAIEAAELRIVMRLASIGAPVNELLQDGRTPLIVAIESQAPVEMIEMLLHVGADPELSDANGRTPVDVATKTSRADCQGSLERAIQHIQKQNSKTRDARSERRLRFSA